MTLRAALGLALGLLLAAGTAVAAPGEVPETIHWSSSVGEVVFPHQRHAVEFGAECVSCHHETVAANLAVPHPSYFDDFWVDCKVCHTGALKSGIQGKCATCHPERPTGLNQEMPTVKVAIHRNCWSCHDRGTGAEASSQCSLCHQRPTQSQALTSPDRSPAEPPAGAAAAGK